MLEILVIYFLVNIVLALIFWFAGVKDTDINAVGYFVMMIFLGLVLAIILCILFIIVILMGASYNFGAFLEKQFGKIL